MTEKYGIKKISQETARARHSKVKRSFEKRQLFLRNLIWNADCKWNKVIFLWKVKKSNTLYKEAEIYFFNRFFIFWNYTPWCKRRCTLTTHQSFSSSPGLGLAECTFCPVRWLGSLINNISRRDHLTCGFITWTYYSLREVTFWYYHFLWCERAGVPLVQSDSRILWSWRYLEVSGWNIFLTVVILSCFFLFRCSFCQTYLGSV